MRITLVAVVLALATALFAVGAIAERSSAHEHDEPSAAETDESGEAAHDDGEEKAGERADENVGGDPRRRRRGKDERLLGVDLESTPLVVLAVLTGLTLATIAASRFPRRRQFLATVVLIAPAWAALDVREALHQLDDAQEAIAVVAAAVALLHLLTAGAAGCSLRASQ